MAFKLHKIDNSQVVAQTTKQIPANTEVDYKVGQALVITSGKAALATGSVEPSHICLQTGSLLSAISAAKVEPNQEYETTLAVDGTLTVGTKVTIHSDSAQVTATTTDGVAEVISADGTTSGSRVIVRF